ncbi:hypothetical protein DY218_12070 [Streptomyces triticagri]|uniref:PH domain-containing protein n=1 Tax=Streptomyces triticagri TaxID=2293568 RepID=A0A372M775_9ACTN|nr:hypothetical protein DY218_12070 [Streptomyces triticagri]
MLGGLGGTVTVSLGTAAAGARMGGGARLALAAAAVLVVVLVTLGVRRMWRVAGDRRACLGVGPQGVWWYEQGVAVLFPWQALAGTAVLGLRTRTARSSYVTEYLELFTVTAVAPVHRVVDCLVVDGHYRLELPDAWLLGGLLPLTRGIADPLSGTLAQLSPGRWWGRTTRDRTAPDRMRRPHGPTA